MNETNMGTTILENNNKIIKYLLVIFIFIFILQNKNAHSSENRIIFKIDNQIITNIDVENEINYLTSLNPKLKKLNNFQLIEISENSLIREKIKQIEISKYSDLKIPEEYLDQLVQNVYKKIGLQKLDDFKKFLKFRKINFEEILLKIETEAIWNEIIVIKFSNKIKIDKTNLRKKILKSTNNQNKIYLMSEILFEVNNENELENKYNEIIKSINKFGFENTASKYSVSQSADFGGKLDWINENTLNNEIKKILNTTKINEITKPIIVPGGFLILKVNNIKLKQIEKNVDSELNNLIKISTNNQLNQYSIIYYNKIKEDVEIKKF